MLGSARPFRSGPSSRPRSSRRSATTGSSRPPRPSRRLDYKPIPWRVAYRQFQPPLGFEERILNYFFPNKYHFQAQRASKYSAINHGGGVFTLGQRNFDHGIYHAGKHIEFTHKIPVIPTNRQHERLSPTTPLGG